MPVQSTLENLPFPPAVLISPSTWQSDSPLSISGPISRPVTPNLLTAHTSSLGRQQFGRRSVTPTSSELAYAQFIPLDQRLPSSGPGVYYTSQRAPEPASKRARTSSSGISRRGSLQDLSGWNDSRQKLFEEHLIYITAACDFSLSWIENPRVVLFFQTFLPHVRFSNIYSIKKY